MNALEVCPPCLAGMHSFCLQWGLGVDEYCCCDGHTDLMDYARALYRGDDETPSRPAKTNSLGDIGESSTYQPVKQVGKSGYIPADAWAAPQNIGELSDPRSTGRKRAARMFPITPGMVCEWANLKNVGFSPRNIVGCMGNPASDIHHGPDKNTLNNSKTSRGIGIGENVHLICSWCHNAIHAANNKLYPDYDRVLDQDKPWLPMPDIEWDDRVPIPATFEELVAEEQRRREDEERRGKNGQHRGRNSESRSVGDTSVTDDE